MLTRFVFASLVVATAAAAEPLQSVTADIVEAVGENVRACIRFDRGVGPGGADGVDDFIAVEPAVRPTVTVDGTRLCLDGLAYGTHYRVTVRPGLSFADGSRQTAAANATVDTPDRDAMVAVGGRGWILPRQGSTGVTVQTVNVPLVRIRVLRVSARSLAANTVPDTTSYGLRPDPARQSFHLYELRSLLQGAATEIWSGTMQAGPGRNRTVETAFPLAGVIDPSKPGAYLVLVEDASRPKVDLTRDRYDGDDYRTEVAGHWVLSSDLGLNSMAGRDGLHVSVRSLASAALLPGVRLQLLSVAQDVLGEVTTGADGDAVFAPGLLRGKRGAAAAVLVATAAGGDMAVQSLTAPAFDLSDRGAEGRVSPGPIEAYVYTDRGIYRPGETVHVTALLRTQGMRAVENTGLVLVLRRPDGVEAGRTVLPPAPAAGFVQPVALSATAAQGTWTVEAFVDPSLPPIGRVMVAVQDFVPQQLKVALTGPTAALEADGHLQAAIDGRFLYGAPGAGLHAEGEVRLVRDEHPVPGAPEYAFGDGDETVPDAVQKLALPDADAAGHVAIDATVSIPDVASPLRAVLSAGLTEPGGRAVTETLSVPVRNRPLLLGIRTLFDGRVDRGSSAGFAVRTFGPDGVPVARSGLGWRLVRLDRRWDWWRDRSGDGRWTFHYHTDEYEVARGTLDVAAGGPAGLARTLDWGDYKLVVSDGASGVASSVRFSVGWGAASAVADVPDRIEVATDRGVAGTGQTVRVHLRGPFAGPAQLVVESAGRVLDTRRIDLPGDGTTVDFVASEAWGAGVHVLAEAFRPLDKPAGAHDPVRAVGLAWIATDPSPHTLSVSVTAPDVTVPRHTVSVPVHVGGAHGPAFVTLAAMDEGILQLTHFRSPDPVAALLGRTRFGLDLRDDYGRLLDGHADAGALHEGGDEGAALGGAGLAVTTTRTVALFHGPVALDANGDAVVPLDLPDFAGELRLMAVAYDGSAAGHAEAAMRVRDPVVADLALPRFLAPGDVAEVTVSLNDTDGPAGDYRLAVTASGAAAVQGAGTLELHLQRGERREARLALAGTGIGVGHIEAVLTGPDGMRIVHKRDIAVRSPHPDLVLSRTDTQAPGERFTFDPATLGAFLPGSVQLTVGYSADAGIDVPGLLQSLYTYPYGCTEQLSSSALPLLYFSDARLLGRMADAAGVRARVQAAIATIIDRQDAAGRFGLWRVGDRAASVWLNVYALDFLLHAREAGFAVPGRVTDTAVQWVERQLERDDLDGSGYHAEPAQPTRAYAAYVLARTDRVDPSRLRALSGTLDWQGVVPVADSVTWRGAGLASPLSLAHLAGAQSLMGGRGAADGTFGLAEANLDARAVPDYYYSAYFWSRMRDEAGVLAVAVETGHDAVAARLLDRLRREHPKPEAMNTQEKASLLMAAHALAKRGGTRSLSVDGGSVQTVALPYAVSPTAAELARGVSVGNAGDLPVFRTVTLRGVPAEAPPALSNGYRVERRAYTLTGEPMDDTALRQTDRFIVELSGAADGTGFRRTVVDDPLPAGLEIEAAVLAEEVYPFLGQLTAMRAHEERDDRFVAAFDLGSNDRYSYRSVDVTKPKRLADNQFRVAYVVRAVTPGRFVRPEVVVEDMYRPDVMARTAAGRTGVGARQ